MDRDPHSLDKGYVSCSSWPGQQSLDSSAQSSHRIVVTLSVSASSETLLIERLKRFDGRAGEGWRLKLRLCQYLVQPLPILLLLLLRLDELSGHATAELL
jgi:hypothetical protein